MRMLLLLALTVIFSMVGSGCLEREEMVRHSVGDINEKNSRAVASSVIALGRDDDDGMAKKWHVGGGED